MADEKEFSVNLIVTASYKTGVYIGKILELRPEIRAAVQVLAVAKHPEQGNLHQFKQTDVGMFHERNALAFREVAWMPLSTLKPFEKEVPDYKESLIQAVDKKISQLDDSEWGQRCRHMLNELKEHYLSK